MGVLVQREFTVAMDDRAEFERQSRLGVWEDQRNNGSQMITAWHEKARPTSGPVVSAWERRDAFVVSEATRLLMVQTTFGEMVSA